MRDRDRLGNEGWPIFLKIHTQSPYYADLCKIQASKLLHKRVSPPLFQTMSSLSVTTLNGTLLLSFSLSPVPRFIFKFITFYYSYNRHFWRCMFIVVNIRKVKLIQLRFLDHALSICNVCSLFWWEVVIYKQNNKDNRNNPGYWNESINLCSILA